MTTTAHTLLTHRGPRWGIATPVPAGIIRSRRGRKTLLLLSGEFDISSAVVMTLATGALLSRRAGLPSRDVVFDLRRVSFMDSRGLAVLATGARSLLDAGHRVTLARPGPHLAQLLGLALADDWLPAGLERPDLSG